LEETPDGEWISSENLTDALSAIDQLIAERDVQHDEIAQLEARLEAAMQNLRDYHAAFESMRDDINEGVGDMPSAESSLRNGPELSFECADIAQAVTTHVTRLEARLREAAELLIESQRCLVIAKRQWAPSTTNSDADVIIGRNRDWLAANPKAEEADCGHDL
jgi:ParB-like chromosome segregation protein Spo0J